MTILPHMRRGVTRTVLVTRRWAVKVPSLGGWGCRGPRLAGWVWSFTSGVRANLSELEITTHHPAGVCPVRFSLFGLVNVYPRCRTVPDGVEVDYDAIGFDMPADRKPANVGYLGDRLVWIDYDLSWADCTTCRRHAYQMMGGGR